MRREFSVLTAHSRLYRKPEILLKNVEFPKNIYCLQLKLRCKEIPEPLTRQTCTLIVNWATLKRQTWFYFDGMLSGLWQRLEGQGTNVLIKAQHMTLLTSDIIFFNVVKCKEHSEI